MDIKFHVTSDGWLDRFTCAACEKEIDEFVIPAKVGCKEVCSIGILYSSFSKLIDRGVERIKRVVIEDEIKEILDGAFAKIKIEIDEVHWPAQCERIPRDCFYNTPLKEIQGINNVKKIGESAFACTNLKTITWPASCDEIPESCFYATPLEGIKGIDNVKKIGVSAFAYTELKTITWPVNCERIPVDCFCRSNLEEIIFPSGEIRDIDLYDLAFSNVDIKKIDLSIVDAVNFIRGHSDVDYQKLYEEMKSILKLPYYVTGLE